jgi:hypothetical protein
VIGQLEEFARRVSQELQEPDWDTRREIVRALVRRVEIDEQEVRIVYRVSPTPVEGRPQQGCSQHCWGRGHRALRCSDLRLRPLTVLGDPRPEPFLDEAEDPSVGDPVLEELTQPSVADGVELLKAEDRRTDAEIPGEDTDVVPAQPSVTRQNLRDGGNVNPRFLGELDLVQAAAIHEVSEDLGIGCWGDRMLGRLVLVDQVAEDVQVVLFAGGQVAPSNQLVNDRDRPIELGVRLKTSKRETLNQAEIEITPT